MSDYKLGKIISIIENGNKISGKITSMTFDAITYGSKIIEKKYFIHWDDGRITKNTTGEFFDTKIISIKQILV